MKHTWAEIKIGTNKQKTTITEIIIVLECSGKANMRCVF